MNMIVAADQNWGIGRNGGLLTHLPGDLKYFKERTLGKVVVMGRKTLESLPGGKPLPGRINIVLTSNPFFEKEGCIVVNSFDELRAECSRYEPENVMLIGGAQVYNMLMEECESLYITRIFGDFDADVHIKNADLLADYKVVWHSDVQEEKGIKYQFLEYKRQK